MTTRTTATRRRAVVPVIVTNGYQASATWSLDTAGLSGITAYAWEADRVATGDTTATPPTLSSHIGAQIRCKITHSNGEIYTPEVKVHAPYMMMPAMHQADDRLLANCPHNEATFISKGSGNWSSTATWYGGAVPTAGANVLVRHGDHVVYNIASAPPRLNYLRIDGKLEQAQDQSTEMLVDTIFVEQDGEYEDGQSGARLDAAYKHTVTFSDRSLARNSAAATKIDLERDPDLITRGFLSLGTTDIWAKDRHAGAFFKPVQATDTSITIVDHKFGNPALWLGLEVGDTIILSSTKLDYAQGLAPIDNQDEEVTVTGISTANGGHVVTFTPALVHDHDDFVTGRLDCYPAAVVKNAGNIIFNSESTYPKERGHFMLMHPACEIDLWGGIDFVNLGRTEKRIVTGVIADDDFRSPISGSRIELLEITDTVNTLGRYDGPHFHMCGSRTFVEANNKRRECHDVFVGASTGWGIVHHKCHFRIFHCAVYGAWGAGIVAEQGNETGPWVGNFIMGCSADPTAPDYDFPPSWQAGMKIANDNVGRTGDFGRHGVGLALASRVVRNSENYIASCGYGIEMWFRRQLEPANATTYVHHPAREDTDWTYIAAWNDSWGGETPEHIFYHDAPIQLDSNMTFACVAGVEVTKPLSNQGHDFNIIWNNHKAFGCKNNALRMEYVSTYMMHWADLTCEGIAINFNVNAFQNGAYNCQTATQIGPGIRFYGDGDVGNDFDLMDAATNWRWANYGQAHLTNATASEFGSIKTITDPPGYVQNFTDYTQIRQFNADWQNDVIDEGADPYDTYPEVLGAWDGQRFNSTFTRTVTNADGEKIDQTSNARKLFPPPWQGDVGNNNFFRDVRSSLRWRDSRGYYKVAGMDSLVTPVTWTDALTGRPAMYIKRIEGFNVDDFGGTGGDMYLGTWSKNATPITAADIVQTCAKEGSLSFDVTAGATGSNGTFSAQDLYGEENVKSPRHGEISWAGDTVTYIPDPRFEGADEFYVMIYSDGHYKTRQVKVLVGAAGTIPTPVDGTNFSLVGGAGQVTIRLGEAGYVKPDCQPRKPRIAQYSTDGGNTWRRLCYWWAQTNHVIDTGSDGVALTAGTYDVRLRYITDHDNTVSSPSSASVIVVT